MKERFVQLANNEKVRSSMTRSVLTRRVRGCALKFAAVAPLFAGLGCGTLNSLRMAEGPPAAQFAESEAVQDAGPLATNGVAETPYTLSLKDGPAAVASPELPSKNPVVPVAYQEYVASANIGSPHVDGSTEPFDAAYAGEVCVESIDGAACGCATEGCGGGCAVPVNSPQRRNAQEYIFDGGDQQPTVVIQKDWTAAGVDPTDTVIYYETLGGQVCVQPSNRVPIYAPRFGAVRQVTGAVLASRAIGTERMLAPVKPGRFDDTNLIGTVMQPLAPHGEEQVNLIDAFQENAGGTPLAGVLPPQRMSEARVPFEQVDVLGTGRITDEEIAVLGQFLMNARTWFLPESLDIMIEGEPAQLIVDSKKVQDVHVYEMPDKCAMRICKTASHTIAHSGDIVSFTIRFDNAGVKPLGNAVIMDSLSPRLEDIEGSQQSSVDVRFTSVPKEVGSEVLRWEIVEPIEKNDGGVISFDCLVR